MNEDKNWAKEANQLHVEYHELVLGNLPEGNAKQTAHSMFDTLVLWIEKMQAKIDNLKGRLEEAEKWARAEKGEKGAER